VQVEVPEEDEGVLRQAGDGRNNIQRLQGVLRLTGGRLANPPAIDQAYRLYLRLFATAAKSASMRVSS
jgi:hypothetical protein